MVVRGLTAFGFALVCGLAAPAWAQDMKDMPGMPMPATTPAQPAAKPPAEKPAAKPDDMPGMDMSGGEMSGMDMSRHDMGSMTGALGGYSMTREASGTSWQPDVSSHDAIHFTRGDWALMLHGDLVGVYDHQSGPRGAEKSFAEGMVMLAARRDFGADDTLNLRAMASPDAFMGPDGYPLLLQTGETANGRAPLVDRQHPHDLMMELSASWAHRWSATDSVFVYAGYPGEPAFGPPAFMHRQSGMDDPAAPITHHWLDSTHITFGVLTAGWVHDDWKLEASSFTGREPDQHRFDFDPPKLDSTSVRLSWNPAPRWALQGSWAHLASPEQLDPTANETRWSASAIYTAPLGEGRWWSTTLAFGRKQLSTGVNLDGGLLESAVKLDHGWTVFGRVERVQNDELAALGMPGPVETVSEATLGAVHDWRIGTHESLGLGASYTFDFVPDALSGAYGADPHGTMVFVRLKID